MRVSESGDGGDRIFDGSFCTLIAFDWEFGRDEFLFEELSKETGWKGRLRFRNACGTKNESSDYHLHLRWRIDPPKSLSIGIEFVKNHIVPDEKEGEPFAEDFLGWFDKFIITKEKRVDMYADFDYPNDPTRQLRFPLPMKAPIGPQQTEVAIDGISFRLSPPIMSVEKVWLTQDEKEVSIHLHAEKTLNVATLDPRHEILQLTQVLDSLFEKTKL